MSGNITRSITITGNYTLTPNLILRDNTISFRAKGLYFYFMSLPPNWNIKLYDLKNRATEGREATRSAFKELEERGYVTKTPVKSEDTKQFTGWDYVVYDFAQPLTCKKADLPETRKSENLSENNKYYINNDYPISNTTDVDSLKTGNSNFLIAHPAVADVSSLDDLNKNINKSENKDNKSENKIKDKPDKNNINLFDINKNICIDNKIIKYWNKKNNVVKHLNHSTKLYKQTNEIINKILEGTYKPELNKPFMLDNHLKNLYKAPIDFVYITDIIDLFDKSLDADHTGDKAKSPKSLKDFFCNRNGYSTFLYLARHGITKSDAVVPSVFFNYLSPVMRKAVSKLINRRMPHASDNTLSQIYVKALNTQKEILRLIAVFKSQGGSPYTTSEKEVTKQWIAYIERLPELYPSSFDTGTIFDNFVNHVCQLHGVNDKYVVKKKHEEAHVVYNAEELYGDDDFDDLYK